MSTALYNPYDPGSTRSLGSYFYFPWNDDGDGVFEAGECPADFPAVDTNGDGQITESECESDSDCVRVVTLSADQQQNYANWYSYYRKREYVLKKAVSEVISRSTARMGLATLNNNNAVGTPITDTAADINKDNIFDNLFQIDSTQGTPLRLALERAGKYFEEGVGGSGTDRAAIEALFGDGPGLLDDFYDPTKGTAATADDTLDYSPIFTADNGGACQKNFTVLMSDGWWNGGPPSVGNADGGTIRSAFDGGSYADSYENTLADVAMHYYERDLAASLADDVATSAEDPNSAQHMVTFVIAFGVDGTLTENPAPTDTSFPWPNPTPGPGAQDEFRIDDMRHAAWNGRGEFLSAADPQAFIDAFGDALDSIESRVSSASSVSFNSTSLENGALLFRAEFNPAGWTGDLRALAVTSSGIGAERWSAASRLGRGSVTADNRQIITFNGARGVPFRWPADHSAPTDSELSAGQVSDLVFAVTDPGDEAAFGRDMVNFLRGDHAEEMQQAGNTRQFRNRQGARLGDIVHSAPVFVGVPDAPYPNDIAGGSNLYSDFIAANSNRREMVYVGANDGMLHAFDADTGDEVFAYIPRFLFSAGGRQEGLHYLADGDYAHRSYVDLTATAGDVFVNNRWRTYLAGGARAGGRGVYVLDITKPNSSLASAENNADDIVVSEFDSSDDPDLGFTYSQITLAKMNNGRWAAVFGNGYNNTGDGTAKIFILYLDSTGGYEELETGVGDNDPGTTGDNNGMSTPEVVDLDNNGTADRIYAGDVLGNMWAFDVSSDNPSQWRSAYGTGPTYTPFFVAADSGGNPQPITSKPSVDAHPTRSLAATSPNLLVTFGTGQYLAAGDVSSSGQQTFYGVWDAGVGGLDRGDLVTQTFTETTVSGTVVRTNSANTVNYNLAASTPEYGWKIDLTVSSGAAERNVVDPAILGPIVFFNTLIPESVTCEFGGTGFLMSVDLLTGGQPPFAVFEVVNNRGIYSGIKSQGVPTAPAFVTNRDPDDGYDATRYVNTSRGIESSNIGFGPNNPSRTSWTNLSR